MMTIEELRDFSEKTERIKRRVDYHTNQAVNFKRLYELTRNRKGIYRLLNTFAKKRNLYHCQQGTGLAISQMKSMNEVFKEFDVTKEDIKKYAEEIIDNAYASIMKES